MHTCVLLLNPLHPLPLKALMKFVVLKIAVLFGIPNCWVSVVVLWSEKAPWRAVRVSLAQWGPVFPSGSLEGLWLRISAPRFIFMSSLGQAAHTQLMGTVKGLLELNDLFIYCSYIYLLPVSKKRLCSWAFHLLPSAACTLHCTAEIFPPLNALVLTETGSSQANCNAAAAATMS